MAVKKTERKTASKSGTDQSKTVKATDVIRGGAAPVPRPAGPSARNCPLVLDGEVDASDFSLSDCQSCGEFDCRFCRAEEGSGGLGSRLFAGDEDGDDDEDRFGSDFSPDQEEGGEEEEDDLF